jgi:hypothetical protein
VTTHDNLAVAAALSAAPARLRRRAWQRYSAGAGAKGHRYYDWAWAAIDPRRSGHHHLLIRRSRHTGELAFYRCYSPRRVCLPALVTVAGTRWTTEIPLTRNEIAALFSILIIKPATGTRHRLR